jgi:hypothetical protein
MKQRIALLGILALSILRLLWSAPADIAGLRYEHRKTAAPHSIHILEVDPRLLRIEAVRALNDGVGRETVSSIALRTGAVAAVNGGFFRIGGRYDGEPDGVLKIAGQWFSDPVDSRGAVGWSRGGEVCRIGRVAMQWKVRGRDRDYPVDGINRPRGAAETILYNWAFHRSTLTDPDGTEILVSRDRIVGIRRDGDSAIPLNGFVYSLGAQSAVKTEELKIKAQLKAAYELRAVGDAASAGKPGWESLEYIVGGVPTLLLEHQPVFDSSAEKMRAGFAEELHPRTAVGLRADGTWVFMVVDGRQPELSVGMNLRDISGILLSLGCVDALNLDGGGSSTLYLQGKIVNSPSDAAKERPVSDAIVIRRK